MKNNITKIPRMCGMLRWQSPIFIIALAILFIIDSILNGEGMGDVVLCFAPFFSGLKDKLTKGLNILNEKLDQLDDEEDDEEEDEDEDDEEDDEDDEDDDEDDEEDDGEEEDIEDVWKRRIAEKYARGEKLTPREQFALELIQENEEIRAEQKRSDAEYEAKMEAEKEAKKQKRKEMFSKVGKAIASIGANSSSANGPATNNSQGGSSTQKKVAKVWGMKYVGPKDNRAPGGIINVPSGNQTGRPTTSEIREALQSLGYSSADASALAGPDSWWKAV